MARLSARQSLKFDCNRSATPRFAATRQTSSKTQKTFRISTPVAVQCGPLNEVAKYYELTLRQSMEIFDGTNWEVVAKLNGGAGFTFSPWYAPFAEAMALTYNCASVEHKHKFRNHYVLEGKAEGNGLPLPKSLYGDGVFHYCT